MQTIDPTKVVSWEQERYRRMDRQINDELQSVVGLQGRERIPQERENVSK